MTKSVEDLQKLRDEKQKRLDYSRKIGRNYATSPIYCKPTSIEERQQGIETNKKLREVEEKCLEQEIKDLDAEIIYRTNE